MESAVPSRAGGRVKSIGFKPFRQAISIWPALVGPLWHTGHDSPKDLLVPCGDRGIHRERRKPPGFRHRGTPPSLLAATPFRHGIFHGATGPFVPIVRFASIRHYSTEVVSCLVDIQQFPWLWS